ncbi:MAG: hypothetical protein M0Z37_09190 [Nitrospiraceae bacterium]|jgi:hypothetical protein|nr:hypothetical protein [Nitrospiraceae bacterium]
MTSTTEMMASASPEAAWDTARFLGRKGLFEKPFRLPLSAISISGLDQVLLEDIGQALYEFYQALDALYRKSSVDPSLSFVSEMLDRGKPRELVEFGRSKKFRHDLPGILRPDLLITPSGPVLTEMDSVPGGVGLLHALTRSMRDVGGSGVFGGTGGMLSGFASMIRSQVPDPSLAILVSDESHDYRSEMRYLAECLDADFFPAACLHPREISFDGEGIFRKDSSGNVIRINIIYRFFELFDLPNIPKIDIIQYFVKGGKLKVTPPFKPWLEEKLGMALWHHHRLDGYWKSEISESYRGVLNQIIPKTWPLDPTPVPAGAAIVGLEVKGRRLLDFQSLVGLTQKERELIIKPSGFSPESWGSRGVVIGHDLPEEDWNRSVADAFSAWPVTPHILQPFVRTSLFEFSCFDIDTDSVESGLYRVRACPYYFVRGGKAILGGVLITACPQDKKIIHGMTDAILAPGAPVRLEMSL